MRCAWPDALNFRLDEWILYEQETDPNAKDHRNVSPNRNLKLMVQLFFINHTPQLCAKILDGLEWIVTWKKRS